MRLLQLPATLLACPMLVAAVACGGAGAADEGRRVEGSSSSIVGGGTSGPEHDAVVQIARDGALGCTGTLIAPNLVLTARHCVAGEDAPQTEDGCGLGRTLPASSFTIKIGAQVTSGGRIGKPDARASKVFTTTRASICSFDVALLQLDRDLGSAKIAKVRLEPLAKGEKGLLAVGYGVNGRTQDLPSARRARGDLAVLAVGPTRATFTQRSGERVPYDVPANDIATGESTCNGDSGGPLFDAEMRVVAVTSRGLPVENSCLDLPALYAGVAGHADLIKRAALSAGATIEGLTDDASLPSEETTPDETGTTDEPAPDETGTSDESAPDETGATDEASDTGDGLPEDDTEAPAKTSKKKTTSGASEDDDGATPRAVLPASGCSTVPRTSTSGAGTWFASACVGFVVALRRRARRR